MGISVLFQSSPGPGPVLHPTGKRPVSILTGPEARCYATEVEGHRRRVASFNPHRAGPGPALPGIAASRQSSPPRRSSSGPEGPVSILTGPEAVDTGCRKGRP